MAFSVGCRFQKPSFFPWKNWVRLSPCSHGGFGVLLVVTELMLHGENFCWSFFVGLLLTLQESVVEGKNVSLSTYWEGILV